MSAGCSPLPPSPKQRPRPPPPLFNNSHYPPRVKGSPPPINHRTPPTPPPPMVTGTFRFFLPGRFNCANFQGEWAGIIYSSGFLSWIFNFAVQFHTVPHNWILSSASSDTDGHHTVWNSCCAGYMSSKACSSGRNVLDLWVATDHTDRQLYSVMPVSGAKTSIIGVNVSIANIGRIHEGCSAHICVGAATVGRCATTTAGMGSLAGIGSQSWRLENVPGEPNVVLISSEVGTMSKAWLQSIDNGVNLPGAPAAIIELHKTPAPPSKTYHRHHSHLSPYALCAGAACSWLSHALSRSEHELQYN